MYWTVSLIFVAMMGFWFQWRYRNRRLLKMANKIPGPTALPLLGNGLIFMGPNKGRGYFCFGRKWGRAVVAGVAGVAYPCILVSASGEVAELKILMKNLMKEYGEVLRLWLGPELNILLSNPDDLKLLLSSSKTSAKGGQYKYLVNILGGGLLSGSGPSWKNHRKIATPNFGKQATSSYVQVFNKEADLLLDVFRRFKREEQIDIYKYIVQTTSYAVCQTLMGLTREETIGLPYLQDVINLSPIMYSIVFDRMTKWFMQIASPVYRLTKSYQIQKDFLVRTNNLSIAIIKLRIEKLAEIEDSKLKLLDTEKDSFKNTQLSVIDRFILSRELDAEDLKHETFTIFTASQEATAKLAAYLLLMLAFHPQCQDRIYSEIISVLGNKNKQVTEEELKQMPYLDMAFKEVLRLFPTGAILQRTINEDIPIRSYTLPAGSSLVIPLYHMQRDSRFWDDPDAFNPERFTPENIKKRNAYCYFPFSLGPMDCLGRYFGTTIIKIIVIKIIQEFHLTSTYKYSDLQVGFSISVTSSIGFPVILTPRSISLSK